MIDDDTIRRMAAQAGLIGTALQGPNSKARTFARAIYALGRDAGLDEAAEKARAVVSRRIKKSGDGDLGTADAVFNAIRALKENKS